MPKISVVVAVYNAYAFLDRCLVSILQQSYPDFELVVVDDCSTDLSALMVRQFARNDSRITLLVHQKNKGLGAGRNTGVAAARGEYVTFVDGDDFIEPNLLECMVSASDNGRFDIVETGCQFIDFEDKVLWNYTPTAMKVENLDADPDNMLLFGEWGVTQKLWRRSLFQNDNPFPEGMYWEDIALLPTLFVNARSLVRTEFVGYNYLQHSATITHSRSAKHVLDLFRAMDHFIAYLRKQGSFERYRGTISRLIEKFADYIANHMRTKNRSKPERADYLILLSEMLAKEYRVGRYIARHLNDASFEAIINHADGSGPQAAANVENEFASLILQAKDDRHAA